MGERAAEGEPPQQADHESGAGLLRRTAADRPGRGAVGEEAAQAQQEARDARPEARERQHRHQLPAEGGEDQDRQHR